MSKKRFLLFDNDGVLVDTEPWYFKANVEILKTMGVDLETARYKKIMIEGRSAFELAEEAGYSPKAVEAARERRNLLYQHYIRTEEIAIPGAREVLAALAKRFRMGIVTSALRTDFELIHRDRGMMEYMEFALCSGEYDRSKPHPDPYLKGLELLGGSKAEALVIEDSERGLRSAVSAGIECVVVHNPFTAAHDFSRATHRIQSLDALEALLR
jgi:HAD superfamily hydrolase (TIGR01509 family)